jgi:hypothetical protein
VGSIVLAVAVVATWYSMIDFPGAVYCYNLTTAQLRQDGTVWVAAAATDLQEGRVRCGDQVSILFSDSPPLTAYVLDAGPFEGYYIGGVPIKIDVPDIYWPYDLQVGCDIVTVFNLSAMKRHGIILSADSQSVCNQEGRCLVK